MKRVLFVDDEASILDGIRRLFRPKRDEWDMAFALGGAEGVKQIESAPWDVVVSDMRMPGIDGTAVLEAARRTHPGSVRLILSGNTSTDPAICAMGTAHQFLAKPCDPVVLERVLVRICGLREILADPALQALIGGVGSLPSPPSTYWALVRALSDPEATIRGVAAIVERDIGVAAKVLQLVNSSFFGRARRVTSLEDAISYLGTSLVRAVALSHEAVRLFEPCGQCRFDVEAFQSHSLRVAGLARRLAIDPAHSDDAFMAGMLHDIGKLVLATRAPAQIAAAIATSQESGQRLHQVELTLGGVSHAEVGGYLLGIWGLPHAIVEAVTLHHRPQLAGTDNVAVLVAVHVADALAYQESGQAAEELDLEFLAAAGHGDRIEGWQHAAQQFFSDCEGEV
jgi:HD-like signal output (HDOD) protein